MDYNNIIKRTVQRNLFEGIKTKRVIGLAGPTPDEYLDILKEHSKEQFLCDYNPSKDYVQKNSLIGLYQLENPDWIDADFCSSIIDNWNDILYLYKELQMSDFQTTYLTFNVSLRTGKTHEYTFEWIKNNIMKFNIVETKKQKFEGKQYITEYITDNSDIVLIGYFYTSHMLSVRIKHKWEINIATECKREIISRPYSKHREQVKNRIYSWYKKGYVTLEATDYHYVNAAIASKLPTKKQFDLGIKKRLSVVEYHRSLTLIYLKEFVKVYNCLPNSRIIYKKFGRLGVKLSRIVRQYPNSKETAEILKIRQEYSPHKEVYLKFLEALYNRNFNKKNPLYEKVVGIAKCKCTNTKYGLKIKELYNQYKTNKNDV